MVNKNIFLLVASLVIGVLVVMLVALTVLLTPSNTHPAYAAASDFINAAGQGEENAAFALLNANMQRYVRENCPDGRVSACIREYPPPEWGKLLSAEFRRAIADGNRAWDILLFATYQEAKGFSGVCIYHRVEQDSDDEWRVAGWSGFISCGEPNAGLQALRDQPDVPNRAP
jgi:hypothetical protein